MPSTSAVSVVAKSLEKSGNLEHTTVMNGRCGKMLATVLALLLGLLPLQGALAMVAIPSSDGMSQSSGAHNIHAKGDAVAKAMSGKTMSATSMSAGCCDQGSCYSGHCNVCSSIPANSVVTSSLPLPALIPPAALQGMIEHINFPLFKPPRA